MKGEEMAEVHHLDEHRPDDAREHTMGELMKELSEEATLLIRQEVALARIEMSEKARAAAVGSGLMGGGAMLAYLGLGALTAAAILGLSEVLLSWLAALVVGAAYLAVALVLFLTGRVSLRRAGSPVPEETVETIKEDAEWIKRRSKSATR
jgi:hypothetical protein